VSASGPITTVAHWQVHPTALGSVLSLVAQLRLRTLEEPGCLGYEVFQAVDPGGGLLVLERYRDQSAVEAHRTAQHYQAIAVQQILPLLSGRQVELLRAIDP